MACQTHDWLRANCTVPTSPQMMNGDQIHQTSVWRRYEHTTGNFA